LLAKFASAFTKEKLHNSSAHNPNTREMKLKFQVFEIIAFISSAEIIQVLLPDSAP